MTLVELMVYTALTLVVGVLAAVVFTTVNRTQVNAEAAYVVTAEVDASVHWLRRDLEETSLGSVRFYPETRRLSMVSARNLSSNSRPGELQISEYGVPRWTKYVYYQPLSKGQLVRWETAIGGSDRLPHLAPAASPPAHARVVLNNLLAPDQAGPGGYPGSSWGGFRVSFVRRHNAEGDDYQSAQNPNQNLATPADNTRLVQVDLAMLELVSSKQDFCSLSFRVMPRY